MDRFFFWEDLQKKPSMFHRFSHVFFGFSCEIVPSTNPVVIRHEKSSSFQINRRPGICWRNAVGSHRTLFFLFRPVGSGREKWLRKLPGSCGLLPLRKTTWACRKVHLLNYHYKVWLIRGTFHEVFVDVNGFYQPRPLKCPSQWLCQPCV